jgi:SulP family sulfate permease
MAGITVGVMLIPQGMAYALIAGLPPIYGLYAALVPVLIYPFIGTSRHMAVGPTALIALLMAAGITPLSGSVEEHITLILLLTLMVGAIQVALGEPARQKNERYPKL